MTWKELSKKIIKYGCRHCVQQGLNPNNPCLVLDCIREVKPEDLRELNLAFLCEECKDNVVTNLFTEEGENEYRCNSCKNINDSGEKMVGFADPEGLNQ